MVFGDWKSSGQTQNQPTAKAVLINYGIKLQELSAKVIKLKLACTVLSATSFSFAAEVQIYTESTNQLSKLHQISKF